MAMLAMGNIHSKEGRLDSPVSSFTNAANLGNTDAMANLADHDKMGDGLEQDANRAFQFLTSAAEGGNKDTAANLSCYLYYGTATPKNGRKSLARLLNLSELGKALASRNLVQRRCSGREERTKRENIACIIAKTRHCWFMGHS